MTIGPGARCGRVAAPVSKSHAHRLVIAAFLGGRRDVLNPCDSDSDDIIATKRCLAALAAGESEPVLDCGESGSTMRFLAPVAAALGKRPRFVKKGRLASRPSIDYDSISPGVFELPGDVSSQFATGLLFALPLLDGDSEIRFSSPLQSRGYVDMTIDVLRRSGVKVDETRAGFFVPGRQRYSPEAGAVPESDWSGAAFWLAMNALGSRIEVSGLVFPSAQPDSRARDLLPDLPAKADVSQCPDLFPALAVVAAALDRETLFTGTARLRIKECDRAAAMRDVLARFGVETEPGDDTFLVRGIGGRRFRGGRFATFSDHRIAMAAAVGATNADSPVELDDAACVSKSYPGFFAQLGQLGFASAAGPQHLAAVSLGSNIEPRREYLVKAVEALSRLPGTRLAAASEVVETDGVGVPEEFADMKFLNQAALFRTSLDADSFARGMHAIEHSLGRCRSVKNGPRTIDIDLIDFDSIVRDDPELTLPHPRAGERDFVRRPFAELGVDISTT